MNKEIKNKLNILALTSLQLAKEYNSTHELKNLLVTVWNKIDDIIEESEIDNDYKQSKRD